MRKRFQSFRRPGRRESKAPVQGNDDSAKDNSNNVLPLNDELIRHEVSNCMIHPRYLSELKSGQDLTVFDCSSLDDVEVASDISSITTAPTSVPPTDITSWETIRADPIVKKKQPDCGSQWPWMKGSTLAIADPIPPVDSFDKRESVKELIAKHRKLIDAIKDDLETNEPLYNSAKHDDLWILRFILSHKKKKPQALEAAKYTLQFRQQHDLDAEDIRSYMPHLARDRNDSVRQYLKYCDDDAIRFVLPDPKRGVVGFFKITGVHQQDLVAHVDESVWLPTYIYLTEWTHQWLDYVTRTTGRLTKTIRFADLKGVELLKLNGHSFKRDAAAMNAMECCYPQLLHRFLVCNAPYWIQIPWRVLRPLFPKRLVEKVDFIYPAHSTRDRRGLYQFISETNLPAQFGGMNEVWPVEFPLPMKTVKDEGASTSLPHSEPWTSVAASRPPIRILSGSLKNQVVVSLERHEKLLVD